MLLRVLFSLFSMYIMFCSLLLTTVKQMSQLSTSDSCKYVSIIFLGKTGSVAILTVTQPCLSFYSTNGNGPRAGFAYTYMYMLLIHLSGETDPCRLLHCLWYFFVCCWYLCCGFCQCSVIALVDSAVDSVFFFFSSNGNEWSMKCSRLCLLMLF